MEGRRGGQGRGRWGQRVGRGGVKGGEGGGEKRGTGEGREGRVIETYLSQDTDPDIKRIFFLYKQYPECV